MDDGGSFFGIFWIGFAVLAVVAMVGGYFANKKRQERLRTWAAQRGWTYTDRVPALTRRWRSAPFGAGSSRRATEVLTGDFHGREVISFTYQYTTGSGKNRTTHYYHVLALHLPVALPWIQLTPEGVGASIAKFFGGEDIEFESHQFNEAWRVKASSPRFAYDLIHPRMMERLLQPDAIGRSITVEGQDIYVHVSGRQRLELIDLYLNLLYGIEQQVPRHLWLNVGHDPRA